jgi:hypothetical protein
VRRSLSPPRAQAAQGGKEGSPQRARRTQRNRFGRGSQAPGTGGGMAPPRGCPHAVRGACEPRPDFVIKKQLILLHLRFSAFPAASAARGRATA